MTSPLPAGPTRLGSVLFTDLVGFTEFNGAAGDAAVVDVLDRQTGLALAAIDGFDGARIVKELGDGLLIWFDSAVDAVEAASALMTAIDDARAADEFPLSMRMGLHHGEIIGRGNDVVGQTVNIAARVTDLAGPGELLVSDLVVSACRPIIPQTAFEPIGPVMIRGVARPIWIERWSRTH